MCFFQAVYKAYWKGKQRKGKDKEGKAKEMEMEREGRNAYCEYVFSTPAEKHIGQGSKDKERTGKQFVNAPETGPAPVTCCMVIPMCTATAALRLQDLGQSEKNVAERFVD